MAEPSFVASGAYLDGSGTSAAVAVPSGTAAGRVALVVIFMDGSPLAVAPTPPTGFAIAPGMPVQIPATSGSHSLYLYWKRLTGADAGTWTFTWAESRYREAQAHLYTDVVATGTPFDPAPGAAFDTTSSTITPAVSCTSAGPDRRLIFTATNWTGGTWTAPAGHTKRMQGGAGVVTLTDRSWPTASATGPVTATCTGSDKRNAWLGALIGTTGGALSAPAAGSTPAAGASTAAVRKVAAVAAVASAAARGTATARKTAPSTAVAAATATPAATTRKTVRAAVSCPAVPAGVASTRKTVPAGSPSALAGVLIAGPAKRASAAGSSLAASYSYRSQITSRPAGGVCGAALTGWAAARKATPARGLAPLAAVGAAQPRRIAAAAARSALAAAPAASTSKTAAVAGYAYAALTPRYGAPEALPVIGDLTGSARALATLTPASAPAATLTGTTSPAVQIGGAE